MSHIVVEKGGIFLERGVDSGRVAYRCLKGVAYILRGRGRFWEDRLICLKGGSVRER